MISVSWGLYVGVPTAPPPPPWGSPAADRPTRRPPRFGSTKGGGRGPPPPPQPPKLSHTPRGHTLAGGGPRGPLAPRVSGQGGPACLLMGVPSSSVDAQDHARKTRRQMAYPRQTPISSVTHTHTLSLSLSPSLPLSLSPSRSPWPADMQSRRDSHRAPPGRPVSLKIGPQIKSNQIALPHPLSLFPSLPNPPPFFPCPPPPP